MSSILSTAGLARASSRHPWRTLGFWLVLIVLAIGASGALADHLTSEAKLTNNPDSQRAAQLLEDRLRGKNPGTETVVIQSASATVDDPAFRAVVEQTTADLLAAGDLVKDATNYYALLDAGAANADQLVSQDRRTTIIPVTLIGDSKYVHKHAKEYVDVIERQGGEGIRVLSVGSASGDEAYGKIGEEDLARGESIGLPAALIVLVVVFGALIAAGLPILMGIASILVAIGLTGLASLAIDMSTDVTQIITMIGLAVGIDYALFVVSRYREERAHGWPKEESIARAGGTAGKTVLFSGGTVVIALLGMFLIPVSVFQSFGIGAGGAVIVAVLATQTLLPALLGLLGDRINWPRRIRYDAAMAARTRVADRQEFHRGFWGTITRVVMGRATFFAILSVVVLLALALPYFDLRTGQSSVSSLPPSDVKTAYEILDREFYAGLILPVEIVVDGNVADAKVRAGIDALVAALAQNAIYGPATVTTNPTGNLALVSVPMGIDAASEQAYEAIADLRETTIPQAFGDAPASVYVGGGSAGAVDFNAVLDDYTPVVFAFVLGLSFVLLLLAFRSIVVPFTAIAMNLLSVGAAYGSLVLVFQKGHLDGFFGFQRTPTIEAWIPIFLFTILFGLSMDYHVFLLSRIREHYDVTRRNHESVAAGLQATARIITGAALIMVAVFTAFASGRLVVLQQMGFGLAVAVFLDATIVRSILVPSLMRLLGDANWYLPGVLRWLPNLSIEGASGPASTTPSAAD